MTRCIPIDQPGSSPGAGGTSIVRYSCETEPEDRRSHPIPARVRLPRVLLAGHQIRLSPPGEVTGVHDAHRHRARGRPGPEHLHLLLPAHGAAQAVAGSGRGACGSPARHGPRVILGPDRRRRPRRHPAGPHGAYRPRRLQRPGADRRHRRGSPLDSGDRHRVEHLPHDSSVAAARPGIPTRRSGAWSGAGGGPEPLGMAGGVRRRQRPDRPPRIAERRIDPCHRGDAGRLWVPGSRRSVGADPARAAPGHRAEPGLGGGIRPAGAGHRRGAGNRRAHRPHPAGPGWPPCPGHRPTMDPRA